MLWIFYIVVFIGLWASRYDELGQMSWIYMMSALAALLFLLFDGTIRRAIQRQKGKEVDLRRREEVLVRIRRNIEKLNEDRKHMSDEHYNKMMKMYEKQIKEQSRY